MIPRSRLVRLDIWFLRTLRFGSGPVCRLQKVVQNVAGKCRPLKPRVQDPGVAVSKSTSLHWSPVIPLY